MKNRLFKHVTLALMISFGLWLITILLFQLVNHHVLNRVAMALGGDALNGGYIQFLSYVVFFLGFFEIKHQLNFIDKENTAYQLKILPEEEHKVLLPEEINKLRHQVIDVEKNQGTFLLTDLVKRACTKFRANNSVSEVMDTVIRQSQLNFQLAESSQSLIRYLAWALPSLGFIGTILGISGSIGSVRGKMSPELINKVTALLGVAFDTTLIALVLSMVLMYLIHQLEEKEEKLHNELEQYVINNLVNRIYVPK